MGSKRVTLKIKPPERVNRDVYRVHFGYECIIIGLQPCESGDNFYNIYSPCVAVNRNAQIDFNFLLKEYDKSMIRLIE